MFGVMRVMAAVPAVLLVLASHAHGRAERERSAVTVGHGLSMYGDLKYGPGFTHFAYTNPARAQGR